MFHVLRGSEELDVEVTPLKASDGAGRIGVQLAQNVSVVRSFIKPRTIPL